MKWKKPRNFKIEDMLYTDRCMLKWHGMLLSDHTERITSDKAAENLMLELIDAYEYVDRSSWDELLKVSRVEKKPLKITVSVDLATKEVYVGIPTGVSGGLINFTTTTGKLIKISKMSIKSMEWN